MTPHLELQKAVVAALKADAALSALVGDRVYDRAPQRVVFPYVAIGEMQVLSDDVDCISGFEVYLTIHVWSRAYGRVECREISSAIYDVLHEAELNLNGLAFVEVRLRDMTDLADPDGESTHGVVTFRALIDEA